MATQLKLRAEMTRKRYRDDSSRKISFGYLWMLMDFTMTHTAESVERPAATPIYSPSSLAESNIRRTAAKGLGQKTSGSSSMFEG